MKVPTLDDLAKSKRRSYERKRRMSFLKKLEILDAMRQHQIPWKKNK